MDRKAILLNMFLVTLYEVYFTLSTLTNSLSVKVFLQLL